ncbi:hypothetical protein EV401DRAFT_234008 [Pisolithus croceorrhizus]|nr:hypothetical protein EV401DRAFT_234008 [Pisolithus croceorrhizus]
MSPSQLLDFVRCYSLPSWFTFFIATFLTYLAEFVETMSLKAEKQGFNYDSNKYVYMHHHRGRLALMYVYLMLVHLYTLGIHNIYLEHIVGFQIRT